MSFRYNTKNTIHGKNYWQVGPHKFHFSILLWSLFLILSIFNGYNINFIQYVLYVSINSIYFPISLYSIYGLEAILEKGLYNYFEMKTYENIEKYLTAIRQKIINALHVNKYDSGGL